MKITSLSVGKSTVIRFVLLCIFIFCCCFYLTRPADKVIFPLWMSVDYSSQDNTPALSSSPLTESTETVTISESVAGLDNEALALSADVKTAPGISAGTEDSLSYYTRAGAAFVFEACIEEAYEEACLKYDSDAGRVAFNK